MMTLSLLPPLSLYVHVPWCVRKCPYCDFNSHEYASKESGQPANSETGLSSSEIPEQAYLEKLKLDLAADLIFVQQRSLKSIFFGGGTPSLMSGEFYQDLLAHISSIISFDPDIEITLEANPGTTEASRFVAYRQAGINRLSLGVQSFNDQHLHRLGRIHSGGDAKRAIEQAKQAGFKNFNIDLMHGLEGQSTEDAIDDLKQAIALNPTHLSWYQLTIEQNTEYFRHPPKLPEDDALWDIQQAGIEVLQQAGLIQYEVSAFSSVNKQAKHNLNYWTFGDYIGLGAGAHSKISVIEYGENNDSKRILRYRKTRMPKDYLKAEYNLQPCPSFRIGEEDIELEDLGVEFLMNVLRLNQGVEESLFSERTGLSLVALEPQLSELRQLGLLEPDRLATTEKGHLFLNSVLEKVMS